MSDCGELFSRGWRILNDRNLYEERQRKWYLMRNEGLRRRNKPFPTAADLHLNLVDQKVNQKKAFTMAQTFGQPQLATFNCLKPQLAPLTEAAQDFFQFEMKHRTNFMRVLMTCVDTMWLRGRGIIKAYVDPYDDYRIVHENIDPMYLLMPDDVNGFDDSYEWIHVRQMNVAKFKQDRRWCQGYREGGEIDGKVIKKLCGGADAADRLRTQRGRDFDMIQEDKELRDGYTHSNSSDTIIIWEHYIRTMGGVTVYSYCPVAIDIDIRKPYGVPYKVNGRVSVPFFSFEAEAKDDGWYSPRGVAEKIADNEIYGSKVWNAKADMLTFFASPMFTSQVGVQNPANYRFAPGEVLPPGITPAPVQNPPQALDQEINFARGEAELNVAAPDMGIEKNEGQRGNEKRTAKEVTVAASISGVAQSNEQLLFNDNLAKLYAHNWGLMLQYKRKELTYFVSDDLQVLPEDALHGDYLIQAGSATENWDRQQRLSRAGQRYQMLLGKPNINQDELVTELLMADDARLVKKLVIPQQQKQASEAADENTEINDMCPGPNRPSFPIMAQPGQDHFVRCQTILGWLDAAGKMGTPVSPAEKQRLFQHFGQHLQYLKKLNPKQFKQIEMMVKKMESTPIQPMQQAPMPPMAMPPRRNVRPPMRPAGGMRML